MNAPGELPPSPARNAATNSARPPAQADAAAALDRSAQVALAGLTGGLSPVSLGLALADWAWHLAGAPGTAARLATQAASGQAPAVAPYADPAWSRWPFSTQATLHSAD